MTRRTRPCDRAATVALIARVRPDGTQLATALAILLGMKTQAEYGARPVNATDRKRAQRQAEQLLPAA